MQVSLKTEKMCNTHIYISNFCMMDIYATETFFPLEFKLIRVCPSWFTLYHEEQKKRMAPDILYACATRASLVPDVTDT